MWSTEVDSSRGGHRDLPVLGQLGSLIPHQSLTHVLGEISHDGQQPIANCDRAGSPGKWTSIVNRVSRSTNVAIADRSVTPQSDLLTNAPARLETFPGRSLTRVLRSKPSRTPNGAAGAHTLMQITV
jgi:hypothetical protein